jgi:hypothetical protein
MLRNRVWIPAGLGAVLLVLGVSAPAAPQQPAPNYPAPGGTASKAGPTAGNPLDEPIQLLAAARQSYQQVKDYTCLFVKHERIRGQLQPENLITMKVRTQPFSVYLRWMAPKASAGQEVCYVAGRNNGMMRVHTTGLLGAMGFMNLDPRDPRAQEGNRHAITEAGIGHLIEQYSQGWEQLRRWNRTQVRIAEYDYNRRRCTRVEAIHLENIGGQLPFQRSVVYFDKENRLPIRVENYDWPRQGGAQGGELLEEYSYADLRLNVGLGDQHFNY